jgi:hypothetical protein
MPDSLIHIKGILNDDRRDSVTPNVVSNKFVARHASNDEFKLAINLAWNDIFRMGGMMCIKDDLKIPSDPNNQKFVPLHMLARVEIETKTINGRYPEDGEGPTQ